MKISEKEIKNKKYNDSYFYIIIFLIIIIFFETTYILFDKLVFTNKEDMKIGKENEQRQYLSSKELVKYFKDNNYDFIMIFYDNPDFDYTGIEFYNDNITFFYKTYTDSNSNKLFLYNDNTINDEYINILNEAEITDIKQFHSYKKWLEENNIEREQLLEMFYYYYQNNPEEVIYID